MSIKNIDTLLEELVSAGLLEKKGEDYRYTEMFSEEFADVLSKRLENIKDRLDLLSATGRKILISKVLVLVLLKHFKVMDRDVAVAGVMVFVGSVGMDTLNAICDKLIKTYDKGKVTKTIRQRTNDDLYTELCPHCQEKFDKRTSVFGFKGKKRTELLKILLICRAAHGDK